MASRGSVVVVTPGSSQVGSHPAHTLIEMCRGRSRNGSLCLVVPDAYCFVVSGNRKPKRDGGIANCVRARAY